MQSSMVTYLEFLLKCNKCWEINNGTFHGVKTFNNDKDLLPRAVCSRLALGDDFSQKFTQAFHIIMLENADRSTGKASSKDNGGMIKFVGDN